MSAYTREHPFYGSPAWKAVRLQALRRDRFRCTVCGAPVHKPGSMRVDHIRPLTTHPHLALSLDNLRTLCIRHDASRHKEKGAKCSDIASGFNQMGFPLSDLHHWNSKITKGDLL